MRAKETRTRRSSELCLLENFLVQTSLRRVLRVETLLCGESAELLHWRVGAKLTQLDLLRRLPPLRRPRFRLDCVSGGVEVKLRWRRTVVILFPWRASSLEVLLEPSANSPAVAIDGNAGGRQVGFDFGQVETLVPL